MNEKSQVYSLDLMVAVGLFLLAVMMLYYFMGTGSDSQVDKLVFEEGKRLPDLLSSPQNSSLSFILGGKVDRIKLQQFAAMDYNETRKAFGLTSDFCIYFEDDQGNVMNISKGLIGIGSERAKIGGKDCGKG